jgi:hypothetical protein
MDNTTATVIVVIIFALIVVAVILRFRQNISVKIKTWLGSFAVDASNQPAPPSPDRPGIKTGKIKAGQDAEVVPQRGRDIETGDVEAGRDASIRDEVPAPKADPPA